MNNTYINEAKYYKYPKQVRFLDLGNCDEEIWIGGIAIGDHIICGCCGAYMPISDLFEDWNEYGQEEFPDVESPLMEYDYWVDLSHEIMGDDN